MTEIPSEKLRKDAPDLYESLSRFKNNNPELFKKITGQIFIAKCSGKELQDVLGEMIFQFTQQINLFSSNIKNETEN
jgi:DNA-binding ferritin-like protein (Dps family)